MTPSWSSEPLGTVATIERMGVAPENIEPGTVYVGLENISSDGSFEGHRSVQPGDLASQKFRFTEDHILYGKLRPYLAKIACPSFQGICSTDILPIRPGKRLEKRFLLHFLRQPFVVALAASMSAGANLPRLNPKVLEGFKVPMPPIWGAAQDCSDPRRSRLSASTPAECDYLPRLSNCITVSRHVRRSLFQS